MSTVFDFDFVSVLKPGVRLPRVALAEIIKISNDGREERTVKQNLVLNLKRNEPLEISLEPGKFLVRIRAASGQFLMRRVQVVDEGDRTSLTLVPAGRYVSPEFNYDLPSVSYALAKSAPRDLSPASMLEGEADPSRAQWTVKLIPDSEKGSNIGFLPGLEADKVVRGKQDFMGLARLRSSPHVDEFLAGDQISDLSTLLVGDINAFQAVRLYGNVDDLHTKWKKPLRKNSVIGDESQEGKAGRFFALSFRAETSVDPLQVACVPGRWKKRDGALAEVGVSYQERLVAGKPFRSMYVEVDDPDIGGLMEFLQQGDLEGSAKMLEQAIELLYDKWRNPYASAAAGYVLIQMASIFPGGIADWPQWLLNLARRYTQLPDGAILFTTLLLQGSSTPRLPFHYGDLPSPFSTVRGAALEAVRRGPPLFRYGLKLMSTNLAILEGEALKPDREIQAAIRYVRKLSLRVDASQSFSVFDVAP